MMPIRPAVSKITLYGLKMQFPFLFFVGYAEGSAEGVHRQHYLLLRLEAVPIQAGAQSCIPSEASSFLNPDP
jgi:hypothetical protein